MSILEEVPWQRLQHARSCCTQRARLLHPAKQVQNHFHLHQDLASVSVMAIWRVLANMYDRDPYSLPSVQTCTTQNQGPFKSARKDDTGGS